MAKKLKEDVNLDEIDENFIISSFKTTEQQQTGRFSAWAKLTMKAAWPRVVWWWNTRRKRFSCDKSLLRVEYRRLTSANVF